MTPPPDGEATEQRDVTTEGEPTRSAPHPGSFGDAAAEMANETEVETPRNGDSARNSDMVEEGSPIDATTDTDGLTEHDELSAARTALAERTADLQRLQAEYLNYKRRVDRDRELIRENSTYAALAPITEVLDTIDRAREHAPLENGLKTVADQLERIVAGLGLAKFGAPGDAFDPTIHEALSHIGEDADVEVTTCKVIAKAGYRIGDRVVRAAQVLVVDPPSGPTA
ncbi:nucleotide exchange factor GrpE [Nocardioides ginsengisegetis]